MPLHGFSPAHELASQCGFSHVKYVWGSTGKGVTGKGVQAREYRQGLADVVSPLPTTACAFKCEVDLVSSLPGFCVPVFGLSI